MAYHIAIDIGASSGRVILSRLDGDKQLSLEEIHRFKNEIKFIEGHYRWNIHYLYQEILEGLSKVKEKGVTDCTLGIDTWAVDYCLVGFDGQLLAPAIAYRDERTNGAMEDVFEKISQEKIYKKTGIQFLKFNTLYQLYRENKELLSLTKKILMVPDYLTYLLTGEATIEITNASTTQLLDVDSEDFDKELLEIVKIPREKFPRVVQSGEVIGEILPDLKIKYNLPNCKVIAVATHDTASAVIGVPSTNENFAYISSGTWSLIGIENKEPIVTREARESNYTNERGAYHTYRFLKNITGMWLIQEIARMLDYKYTYAEMAEQASMVEPFLQYINFNEDRFTRPDNVIEEIQNYCRETNQRIPNTVGELTMCVYSNLAMLYAREWNNMQLLSKRTFDVLHIVGGGANVALLNQLTADLIGKQVIAGPSEATAIGNLMVQFITEKHLGDLAEARSWLKKQFEYFTYTPRNLVNNIHLERFSELTQENKLL